MKFIKPIVLLFCAIHFNVLFSQIDEKTYQANLGEKIFTINNQTLKLNNSITLQIENSNAKFIETEFGTTGLIAIGKMKIEVIDSYSKNYSDSISHIWITFNPNNILNVFDINKFQTSLQTDATQLFDFYIETFKDLYPNSNKIEIPILTI